MNNLKKIFVLGPEGVIKELESEGISYISSSIFKDKKVAGLYDFQESEVDQDIDGVVISLETNINNYALNYACIAIQRGAKFINTNQDPDVPVRGFSLPGPGAILAFVQTTVNQEAFVVGKPNPFLLEIAAKELNIKKERSIIIGDRLEQDILVGNIFGIDTLLVLTGYNKEDDLVRIKNREFLPTYVLNNFSDLFIQNLKYIIIFAFKQEYEIFKAFGEIIKQNFKYLTKRKIQDETFPLFQEVRE